MKIIIIAFLIIFKIGFSQADKSEFKGVSIEREYTAQNYVQPDSILFYSSDHWELERYYEILFKKLKKQFKKTEVFTKFTFEKNDSTSIRVSSFEGMNYNINTKDANAICVFALSKIDTNTSRINKKTGQTLFINKKRILFYDLFMILIDVKTNEILLKRKFIVEANEIFYANNKNIAKAIVQEINN